MFVCQVVRDQVRNLLKDDTVTFKGAAGDVSVTLSKENFNPDTILSETDMPAGWQADFVTSTPLVAVDGTAFDAIDPLTGDSLLEIRPPAGGWRWETTALTNLPQTIYGFAVSNPTGSVLIGVDLLPEPIELTVVGQAINLDPIITRILKDFIGQS